MKRRTFMFALLGIALTACVAPNPERDSVASGGSVVITFLDTSHNEQFAARTSNPQVITIARGELALPLDQRSRFPHGRVIAGDGGVNAPWTWSYAEDDWTFSEISMELCDAWPGYIEQHRDEWIQSPTSFCPWKARVTAIAP